MDLDEFVTVTSFVRVVLAGLGAEGREDLLLRRVRGDAQDLN